MGVPTSPTVLESVAATAGCKSSYPSLLLSAHSPTVRQDMRPTKWFWQHQLRFVRLANLFRSDFAVGGFMKWARGHHSNFDFHLSFLLLLVVKATSNEQSVTGCAAAKYHLPLPPVALCHTMLCQTRLTILIKWKNSKLNLHDCWIRRVLVALCFQSPGSQILGPLLG